MAIAIKILNTQKEEICSFDAKATMNISGQANEKLADIPVACCSGACMVCGCTIISGQEYIDKEKFGQDLVGAPDSSVLTCISGVKDECFAEGFVGEIVLQKQI